MKNQKQKGISSLFGIIIVIVIGAIVGGGILAWQYFGTPKTVDWQTYKNAKYGVEFQYPNSWVLDDKEALSVDLPDQTRNFLQINISNGAIGREDESMSPCQPGVASVVYQVGKLRDGQQTFEEFVNFQIENPEIGTPPAVKPVLIPTTVDGQNALKIEGTIDNCATEFYYVGQNFDRYTTISFIADKNDDKLLFDQMLSTFRFEEKIEVPGEEVAGDETADWKTYRNDEYGFEMKYPEDFLPTQPLQPKTKVIQCDYANFSNSCPTEITNINGMPFCLQKTSEGAAGTIYVTYNYTTVRDRECFVVSFTVPYPNCSNYLPAENQKIQEMYDKCKLDNEVTKPETIDKILSTFRFLD